MKKFDQIYATSSQFSWTSAQEFIRFCELAGIRCDEVSPSRFFNEGMCDGAFITDEYTYSAALLRDHFLNELRKYPNVSINYDSPVTSISKADECYIVQTEDGRTFSADFLLNATYASTNQIAQLVNIDDSLFDIKYELCEVILCDVNSRLKECGITVMDGPFFSIMPFGKTGYHSLTSVTFTPHNVCFEDLPVFECQRHSKGYCNPQQLGNCNICSAQPPSAYPYMAHLARKYLKPDLRFEKVKSLYSMKPILKTTEVDDSRPTVIRTWSRNPTFVSVLSGKINTIFDLDEELDNV